jgi:hypothetical protein
MTSQEQERLELVRFYKQFNAYSSDIQNDIARALLVSPTNRLKLTRQLQLPDHKQAELLESYAMNALEGMMLSTMNHSNMFGKLLALHSNLTGDPLMHDIFDEVNRLTIEEMDCN